LNLVLVSGSETYLVIAYTKLSLCWTFSLIRTSATSLDSQLLGMRRNKVNKWAWRKRLRSSTTFFVPLSDVSAVYDGVSAYRKRLALEFARCLLFLICRSLEKNVSGICSTCFCWLRQIRRIRRSLDTESTETLTCFHCVFVDYCKRAGWVASVYHRQASACAECCSTSHHRHAEV